jgi:hypothetical protein
MDNNNNDVQEHRHFLQKMVQPIKKYLTRIFCSIFKVNNEPIFTALTVGVLVCAVILPLMAISGGMLNPLLATVIFAGCQVKRRFDSMQGCQIFLGT